MEGKCCLVEEGCVKFIKYLYLNSDRQDHNVLPSV